MAPAKIITETNLRALRAVLKNPRERAMVLLSLKAGLRAVEIAGLTWCCVISTRATSTPRKSPGCFRSPAELFFGGLKAARSRRVFGRMRIKPIRYGPLPPESATPATTQAIVVFVSIIAVAAIEIVLASEGVAAIAGPAELIAVAWPRP